MCPKVSLSVLVSAKRSESFVGKGWSNFNRKQTSWHRGMMKNSLENKPKYLINSCWKYVWATDRRLKGPIQHYIVLQRALHSLTEHFEGPCIALCSPSQRLIHTQRTQEIFTDGRPRTISTAVPEHPMTLGFLRAISHDTFFLDATFEALDTATTVARKYSSIFIQIVCCLSFRDRFSRDVKNKRCYIIKIVLVLFE